MSQSQQSRGDDEDEDMHETTRDDINTEEITGHESSPSPSPSQQTAPLSLAGTRTSSAAVRDFTTIVWESSTMTAAETAESSTTATESKPIHRRVSAYSSSSPFSSPGSSLVEGSSGPFEEDEDEHTIFLSPFASIFPDGTNTTTPLFIQRCGDDDNGNNDTPADANTRTILQYSESIQLFRRRPEDGGETWKRRVFEYR